MTYPGGKAGAGVYQAIINQMPPHAHYVEPFAGGGAVLLHKRPAGRSTILDLDGDALTRLADAAKARGVWPLAAIETDALAYLEKQGAVWGPETLCYCDPPYVMASRSGRRIYQHEMTDADHARLLEAVQALRCMVILSGYDNLLYRAALADWRRVTFTGQTRGGPREEVLWCNFAEPASLHDFRYLGADYRERERIRKMVARWQNRFAALPVLERRGILSALQHIETRLGDRDPAPPDLAGPESGTAGDNGGSSRDLAAGGAPDSTAVEAELSERGPHKGGFPQSAAIAGPGGAAWGAE